MKALQRVFIFQMILFFLYAPVCFAERPEKPVFKKKSRIVSPAPSGKVKLPDLVVQNVKWSAAPKAGTRLGMAAILNIDVANKGNAPAVENVVTIHCQSLSGGLCPASLSGTISLMSLAPGKATGLPWPSASNEIWPAGKFKVTIKADGKGSIKESNELNNEKSLIFTVTPKKTVLKKDKPLFKSTIGADKSLTMERGGKSNALSRLAVDPKIDKSQSLVGQIFAVDYTIHSVRSIPTIPHTEEYVKVLVKIENKTPAAAKLPLYFRCKPLDGGACPDGQPGQETVKFMEMQFAPNQTREQAMFHLGNDRLPKGRYLLSAAKDDKFSQGLVFTTLHVEAPEDVPVRISRLTLDVTKKTSSPTEPIRLTAKAGEMFFEILGGGFAAQSLVHYQNMSTGGNIWSIDNPEIQASRIKGRLPVYVVNVPGSYKIWVKNPNGDETEKFWFNVIEPGLPPQINEWEPKTITSWMHWLDTPPSGRWAAYVIFRGKNLSATLTDHWIEYNTVSEHMIVKVNSQSDEYYKLLFWTPTGYPPQDGEIKLWIYNKHTDPSIDTKGNAQWFRLKVVNEPVVIDPPVIQAPEENQKIMMQDVLLDIKDPQGVRVVSYALEWQQKKAMFWMPESIVSEITKSADGNNATRVVPIGKFENKGLYRYRARVTRSTVQAVKEDPQWSPWRKFEVVRELPIPSQ